MASKGRKETTETLGGQLSLDRRLEAHDLSLLNLVRVVELESFFGGLETRQ